MNRLPVIEDEQLQEAPAEDAGPGWGQSLSNGALGPVLLHLTRAAAGLGTVSTAHAWLRAATRAPVSTHIDGSLFCGVTALAYVLHTAVGPGSTTLATLDTHVETLARQRVQAAHVRIDQGRLPSLGEYDLIKGLSGIGAYLLARVPHSPCTAAILHYLVRLTEPVRDREEMLPGWWTLQAPLSRGTDFPGGHGNLGMAHGISGPLALLSLALRCGVEVEGQRAAIRRICAWLDIWRRSDATGTSWPRWVTRSQQRHGEGAELNPMRMAWCYGIPGQARAQQIAAIATADEARERIAVQAIAACAADELRFAALDGSLCHGRAGVLQILRRAADDDTTGTLAPRLTELEYRAASGPCTGTGFLEGSSGKALALLPAADRTRWDACLLTTA